MTKLNIRTLQNVPLSVITNVFNRAFEDYLIPLQMTEAAMQRKTRGDQIDLSLSPGCFVENELCGFILHGVGQRNGRQIAWNGGTGVTPAHRGQGITSRLYDFIIPELRKRDFAESILEVIDTNEPAIHIYRRNGFESTRELVCFKGDISPPELTPDLQGDIELRIINELDWERLPTFWSWQPSFQNAEQNLLQLRNEIQVVAAFKNGLQVGYIAFEKTLDAGNVFQFAVDKDFRGRGIGCALFANAATGKTVPLKLINVDASHKPSISFLEKIGFQQSVSQIEMVRKL